MIWPNHVSTWLVDLTGATGQAEGMMILAGMSLWYSLAIVGTVAVGGALIYGIDTLRRIKSWIAGASGAGTPPGE